LVVEKLRFGCPWSLLLIRLVGQKFCKGSERLVETYCFDEVLRR
jgi:hypothetical protein